MSARSPDGAEVTMDLAYLGLAVLVFALSLGLVELCDRL
jgi:hypothetical protein